MNDEIRERVPVRHFSCYKRRRLLDPDRCKRIVLGVLSGQLARRGAGCIGFVVMPDHVHAILSTDQKDGLSILMQQWKRISSFQINKYLKLKHHGYVASFGQSNPIWQAKYYSFELLNEEKCREKLNYMHNNPVKAGLVENACDWAFSSARHFEQGKPVGIKIAWLW